MPASQLVARLVVGDVDDSGFSQVVKLTAVFSDDRADPNYSFSQATPQASVGLTITNPDAFGFFRPQAVYDLTFTPVVAADPTPTTDPAPAVDPAPANNATDAATAGVVSAAPEASDTASATDTGTASAS